MSPATPRIASLLASGTEIVAALGLGDALVAISHECDWPPELLDRPRASRPRFDPAGLDSGAIDRAVRQAMAEHGSVYEIDGELLARLEPDLVITQAVCEVCAVPTPGVRQALAERGVGAEVLSLDAHTLADIVQSVRTVAAAAGRPERGEELAEELESGLREVQRAVAGEPRPRVLAIEWLDPPFAPGHWVPEMIERAGGENLVGGAGAPSEQVAWDALRGLDPDVLVIMPCGYDLAASRRAADAHAERLHELAPRAIAEGRALVVDGSAYFNRSGPRVLTGAWILGGLFHPERLGPPPAGTAQAWPGPHVTGE